MPVAVDTAKTATQENSTQNMDAVSVAPSLYKVLRDSAGIRIVEVNFQPGDSSSLHWHPDYVVYAIEGGVLPLFIPRTVGYKMDNEMKAGMTLARPGAWHSVKNNGKTNIHVLLVGTSRTGQAVSPDAAMDPVKLSPDIYKLKNDTLGLRVIEVMAKPGQKTTMHSHSDAAWYVLSPGTCEFTGKDGKSQVVKLEKGMTMITPAESHLVKNVGTTSVRAVLVEVNRGMK